MIILMWQLIKIILQSTAELDGNYYETENLYTILVYYKSFIGRADELIGVATFNSRADQPGLSF